MDVVERHQDIMKLYNGSVIEVKQYNPYAENVEASKLENIELKNTKNSLLLSRWKNYLDIEGKEYNLYVENVEVDTLQIEESN